MSDAAPNEPTDAELARRVAADASDARAAFDELHRRHGRQLLAFLCARCPEHAEDVAQDVWVRALTGLANTKEMTNFRAWLFQIARNRAQDVAQKMRPALFADDEELVTATSNSPLAGLIDAERRDIVRACIEKLLADQRAVIEAVLGGEAPEDIAKRLNVSRGTIDSRKHRAIEALQTCVKKRLP